MGLVESNSYASMSSWATTKLDAILPDLASARITELSGAGFMARAVARVSSGLPRGAVMMAWSSPPAADGDA